MEAAEVTISHRRSCLLIRDDVRRRLKRAIALQRRYSVLEQVLKLIGVIGGATAAALALLDVPSVVPFLFSTVVALAASISLLYAPTKARSALQNIVDELSRSRRELCLAIASGDPAECSKALSNALAALDEVPAGFEVFLGQLASESDGGSGVYQQPAADAQV